MKTVVLSLFIQCFIFGAIAQHSRNLADFDVTRDAIRRIGNSDGNKYDPRHFADPEHLMDSIISKLPSGSCITIFFAGFDRTDTANYYRTRGIAWRQTDNQADQMILNYRTKIIMIADANGRNRYYDIFDLCPPPNTSCPDIIGEKKKKAKIKSKRKL